MKAGNLQFRDQLVVQVGHLCLQVFEHLRDLDYSRLKVSAAVGTCPSGLIAAVRSNLDKVAARGAPDSKLRSNLKTLFCPLMQFFVSAYVFIYICTRMDFLTSSHYACVSFDVALRSIRP